MFDFEKDYVLENDRVRLAPLVHDDIRRLNIIAQEDNLWTYFLGSSNGKDNFEAYVKDALSYREHKKAYAFSIFDKQTDNYVGSTRFFDFGISLNTVRLGYSWIGRKSRGTGINRNSKFLMFEFAFEHIGFERIGLGAHAENTVSIQAMKSLGCKQEGSIRNLFPSIHSQGRSDAVLLGMLKEEWLLFAKDELKNRL